MKYDTDPAPDWHDFDKKETIGRTGAEGGIIIADLENIHGARITVERDSAAAPWSITFGIYGLLFHTHFKSHPDEVTQSLHWLQTTINKVFGMYELPEDQRDDNWYHEHDRLVHELTID
jgi:hypothetical protein